MVPESSLIFFLICTGLGHRGYGSKAEEGADRPEPLGAGTSGLSELLVQRLLPDHQGEA